MEYVYYKSLTGNFGDDLNAWLWPLIFDDETLSGKYLIGIGSVICDSSLTKSLQDKQKIIFGSGVRPGYTNYILDDTWDVKFLRGPLSANYFKEKYEYIADAAYALRLVKSFEALADTPKKYEVSVIPYFHSVKYFDWKSICKQLGYNYISPFGEQGIEHTLSEIAASKVVITEAMHGAIIADALRVPWHRFVLSTPHNEGSLVSEFKWKDWLHSINLHFTEATYIQLYRKSFLNKMINKMTSHTVNIEFVVKKMVKEDLLKKLSAIKHFNLSTDSMIDQIDNRIDNKIAVLKQEIKIHTPQSQLVKL